MRIVGNIAVWTLQILTGLLFVLVGLMKFQDPSWARNFARWGYPDGFHLVIGVVEAAGGAALLVPRFTAYAALLLVVVMAGAAGTHLLHGEPQRVPVPLVYMLVVALVGWLRRKSVLPLRRSPPRQRAVI
jgi:uncharacterized membrane protein YphA (DoxX/SURF4 family)